MSQDGSRSGSKRTAHNHYCYQHSDANPLQGLADPFNNLPQNRPLVLSLFSTGCYRTFPKKLSADTVHNLDLSRHATSNWARLDSNGGVTSGPIDR
jgi:hypothetical protein